MQSTYFSHLFLSPVSKSCHIKVQTRMFPLFLFKIYYVLNKHREPELLLNMVGVCLVIAVNEMQFVDPEKCIRELVLTI